ncbi:MCE family protein [Amycolatopsis nigrescens]|uniref:MCE family protein n=1 Tax=Amycolatopsis nigrescens TaxID=381445 RepID=UPI00037DC1F0|nr:MlaD family protein [Amycolatopsis nigrescens]
MLVRRTKFQLVAFAIISVVAIVYALIRFAGLGEVFGSKGYSVRLELAESGGIFQNAEVTYRGYNIGRVGPLKLTSTGLEAQLDIDPDAPPVPADLQAVVANRSAVGEQYVDLRPVREGGETLQAGAVIPVDRTKTPVSTDKLVSDLDSLASSVPTDALRTVVDESYNAFAGTGDDLQVLMDTARDFTSTARDYLPQTVQLLDSGGKVLQTQNAEAGSLKSFSEDLNKLTETLKNSDGDIRKVIDVTPQVSRQISEVLAESGPGLGALLANLLTTSNLLVTRQDGLEQALVTYPILGVGGQTVAPGDGTAHLGLALNLFDPPPCTKGYLPYDQYRGGNGPANVADRDAKADAYCAEPKGSPINVRGSANAPYNGVPQLPTPEDVERNKNRDSEELAANRASRGVPGVAGGPALTVNGLRGLLGLSG